MFEYDEDPNFPAIRIDSAIFGSVMYSLLHNVMKYADRDSTVYLKSRIDSVSHQATLKVESIGEPILPHEKELIFEKFIRGENPRRGVRHTGVGLGLWVARDLIRSVEGDLTVECFEDCPRRSVFIVHIPGAAE